MQKWSQDPFWLKYSALMNLSGLMTVTNVFVYDRSCEIFTLNQLLNDIHHKYLHTIWCWLLFVTCLWAMCQVSWILVQEWTSEWRRERVRERERSMSKLKSPYRLSSSMWKFVINSESKWSLPFISSHLPLRFLETYLN